MPIVDVECVAEQSVAPAALTHELADRLGTLFDSPPGRTWVRLRSLAPDCYAEQGIAAEATPRPVFVRLWLAAWPPLDRRRELARSISECVADICQVPHAQVHVLFEPEAAGRIAFGGELLLPADAVPSSDRETPDDAAPDHAAGHDG